MASSSLSALAGLAALSIGMLIAGTARTAAGAAGVGALALVRAHVLRWIVPAHAGTARGHPSDRRVDPARCRSRRDPAGNAEPASHPLPPCSSSPVMRWCSAASPSGSSDGSDHAFVYRTGRDTIMIEIENLTKRFGHVTAVDDLSFAARDGHVTGFLGPNGAGKPVTGLWHSFALSSCQVGGRSIKPDTLSGHSRRWRAADGMSRPIPGRIAGAERASLRRPRHRAESRPG